MTQVTARGAAGTPGRAGSRPPIGWRLPRPWRTLVLTVHVVVSVAWLGVQGCVVALLAFGLAADSPETAGERYDAAALLVRTFVAPTSLTALVTGLALSLGTPWGLLRYYWVAIKLVLTVALVLGSNLSLGPMVVDLAAATREGTVLPAELERVRPVIALSVAFTVILAATVLSTVKPFGRVRRSGAAARRPRSASAGRETDTSVTSAGAARTAPDTSHARPGLSSARGSRSRYRAPSR